jgi:hypothetical protein
MISNPKKTGTVKIAKETATKWTPRNQHAVDNVNKPMGPRLGNPSTGTKRADFQTGKEERNTLADTINAAYGARAQRDSVDEKMEGIRPVVKPKKFVR